MCADSRSSPYQSTGLSSPMIQSAIAVCHMAIWKRGTVTPRRFSTRSARRYSPSRSTSQRTIAIALSVAR